MSSAPPFRLERHGARLTLWLNTPGSRVNVFGPQAAAQLDEVLATLVARRVETLVLRSDKPGSFVNGAGLLYAAAMQSPREALALSAPVRRVYDRLAHAPVLKVAVIDGACFGCGLELVLCCDVRLATDAPATSFLMTEVRDYRFVPLFGGTYRLPRLLGGAAALDLLLAGQHWSAPQACARGLVDAVLPRAGLEVALARRLRKLERGEAPPRRAVAPLGTASRWLAAAPPRSRQLWRTVAGLVARATTAAPEAMLRRRELEAFSSSVVSSAAKNAMSFFFVREVARLASLGPRVVVSRPAADQRVFDDLVRGGRVVIGLDRARPNGLAVCFPAGLKSRALCEVTSRPGDQRGRGVARRLAALGFEPVVSTGGFACQRLVLCLLAELVHAVIAGAAPGAVLRALVEAGFDQQPHQLALPGHAVARLTTYIGLPRSQVSAALRALRRSRPRSRPAPAELARRSVEALADEAKRCLEDGTLAHPAQADVLVRGTVGYPLEVGGLLQTTAPAARGSFHTRSA
jgi:enoyl-CoA hydratase/carnithine racemase